MKRSLLRALPLLALFLLVGAQAQAQRFAYVNTDYILEQIDEFGAAQAEIDRIAETWRKDAQGMKAAIEAMYRDFQNDRVLLTDDQENERIAAIEAKEQALKDFQQAKFGYQGELFQKRQELIKPIQDRVYAAILELAEDRNYDFIFDKANSTTLLFANPENDKSGDVLKRLGISGK
jgi:outer membrane protein